MTRSPETGTRTGDSAGATISLEHTDFDAYANSYEEALNRGISLSGEDRRFFARRRLTWLAACLRRLEVRPRSVLEYGCGTGSTTPLVFEILGAKTLTGLDVAPALLQVAAEVHGSTRATFLSLEQFDPTGTIDLAFCNGVFHHIDPGERPKAVDFLRRSLRPGGLLSFWENNSWSPAARIVMSRIPFDRQALPLSPLKTHKLLRAGGFEILRTDFLFFFPRLLAWLRPVEGLLRKVPFGAQYQVVARRK